MLRGGVHVGLERNQVHQVPNQEAVSAKITKAST